MDKKQQKNIDVRYPLKKFLLKFLLLVILISNFSFVALAANLTGSDADCVALNKPEDISQIVSIIEEPISTGKSAGYMTCMRKTCCESADGACSGENINSYADIRAAEKKMQTSSPDQSKTTPTPPATPPATPQSGADQPKKNLRCYSDYRNPSDCTPSSNTTGDSVVYCKRIGVFFAGSGAELLYSYIGTVYRWAATTIGIVCVFIIVWSGISVATAGDNSSHLDEAKKRIIGSLTGLVLLFMSAALLYTINPNFFTI